MKALERESETIQRIAKESQEHLIAALQILDQASYENGVMQVHGENAMQCIIHAQVNIEAALKWLNSEKGEDQKTYFTFGPKEVSIDHLFSDHG